MKPDYSHIEQLAERLNDLQKTFNIDGFDSQALKIQTQLEDLVNEYDEAADDDKFLRIRYPHGVPLL